MSVCKGRALTCGVEKYDGVVQKSAKHAHTNRINCFGRPSCVYNTRARILFVCILCSLASLGFARHKSLRASLHGLVRFYARLQGTRVNFVTHALSKGVMRPVRKSAKHAHTNRINCFGRPS